MSITTVETPISSTRATAPFRSLTEMREVHAQLLQMDREAGEANRSPEFVDALIGFVRRAIATGAVLDQYVDRSTAQGLVDYWLTVIYRAGREFSDAETTLAEFDLEAQPELPAEDCPYRGLETFSEENAEFFFGRKSLLNQWLGRLAQERLLAILGPCGSGRTSLITAGLLPALRRGAIPGSERWRYLRVAPPGEHPLKTLLQVVQDGRPEDAEKLAKKMRDNAKVLLELVERDSGPPVVFVLPRFEEVFTLADEAERKALGENLLEVINSPRGHRVLLAMRNDFGSHVGQLGLLQEAFRKSEVFVPPLDANDLHEIVLRPAERVGLKFDEGVVDALIFDVLGDPAALPLLQFTLLKLWDKRERNRITWRAYNAVGGCHEAFARAADEMWAMLADDPAAQEAAKSILLRVIRPGSGRDIICSTVHRDRLYHGEASRGQIDRALNALLGAGLVRTSGAGAQERIAIVNDALATKWPKLVDWLEERRGSMRERRRFTIAAEQWKEKGGNPAALLRGALLEEARAYEELNDLEARFLAASIAADESWRRLRRIVQAGALVAILGLLILLTGNIVQYYQRSKETERGLRLANVERGMRLLDANDPAAGAVWFAELFNQHPPKQLRDGVYRRRVGIGLRQLPRLLAILPHDREVLYAELGADSRRIVTLTAGGKQSVKPPENAHWAIDEDTAWAWTNDAGAEPRPHRLASEFPATSVRISPNGSLVAVTHRSRSNGKSGEGEVRIWDISGAAPKLVRQIACAGPVMQVVWAPDNERVAFAELSGSGKSSVRTVSARTEGTSEASLAYPGSAALLAWSPAGNRIAIAPQTDTQTNVQIWDLTSNPPHSLEGETAINELVFSADGNLLLTAAGLRDGEAGAAQIWKAATGKRLGPALAHKGAVLSAQFSPDEKLVVTGSGDGTAKVWSATSGREILNLPHDSWVLSVAFSPDGRHIATGGRDRKARVWELQSGELACPPMNTGGSIARIAFSRDGRTVLTTGRETPRLWAFSTGYSPPPALDTQAPISGMALSADGNRVATITEIESGKRWRADVWEAASGKRIGPRGYTSLVALNRAALSDDGSLLLLTTVNPVAGKYGALLVDTATAEVRQQFTLDGAADFLALGHREKPLVVILARDGKQNSTIARLWSSETGQPLSAPLAHDVPLKFAAFSPDDGTLLITGGETNPPKNGRAFLRRTDALAETPRILEHSEVITSGGFSQDGSKVVTASEDNCARVWSVADGVPLTGLLNKQHTADLLSASFDPPGERVLTTSYDGSAVVTEWKTGEIKSTFKHNGVVNRGRFDQDGSSVLTASADGAVRLWDVQSNELIAILKPGGGVRDVALSGGGKSITALGTRAAGVEASFQRGVPVVSTPDDALELPRPITPVQTWDIEPLKGYEEGDLQRLSEMLAVQAPKPNGQLELLSSGELLERWRKLRDRYLADFVPEPEREYHHRCALLAEAAKQWFAAAWHLTKLLQENNTDPALLDRRALAYIHLDKPKLALEDLTAALREKPDDPELLKRRARAYIGTQLAAEDLKAALRGQPDDAALKAKRDEANVGPEAFDLAAADCEKAAVSAEPASARSAGIILSAIRAQQGRWSDAGVALDAVLRADPENLAAWQRRAVVQICSGDLDGYRATCAAMIEKFRDRANVGSIVAWPALLSPQSNVDPALLIEIARRAVEESPRNYYRINTLAAALYRGGKYAEAITELERSRNLFAASMAARIVALRDDSIAQAFSEPRLGRAQDWVFLAMANSKLGNKSSSEWWLSKLRQTAAVGAGTENSERRLWNRMELGLLTKEAMDLISPPAAPVSPP